MPSINQIINSTRHLVAKQVDKKILAISEVKRGVWRNKKIISVTQWESWKRRKAFQYKLLEFLPEDFVEIPFLGMSDDKLWNLRSQWYKDYYDYLEEKKSPSFGASKCRNCILHPIPSYCNESLRELMLMGLDYDVPCRVLNIFECPYKQGNKNSDHALFLLKDYWMLISNALRYANNLSRYNDYTYEVDFEKDSLTTYYDVRSNPSPWGRISELEDLRLSKIRVRNIKEIYHVLCNGKELEIILEQYIKNIEQTEDCQSTDSLCESEFLRKLKEPLIEHFKSIKDKIKIERLLNFDGQDQEEEKRQEEKEEQIAAQITSNYKSIVLSGKCVLCKEFSNIRCIGCDTWICVEHWKKHALEIHNKKFQ